MSVLIHAGHDLQRVGALERHINLFLSVLRTVNDARRRLSGLYGLIPDSQNAGTAVLLPEYLILIAYSSIQKSNDHAAPGQVEAPSLNLADPCVEQGGRVKAVLKSIESRYGWICKLVDGHRTDRLPV